MREICGIPPEGVPSWVPDWRIPISFQPISIQPLLVCGSPTHKSEHDFYQAGGLFSPELRIESRVLKIMGLEFDSINDLSSTWDAGYIPEAVGLTTVKAWAPERGDEAYHFGQTRDLAFRTMIVSGWQTQLQGQAMDFATAENASIHVTREDYLLARDMRDAVHETCYLRRFGWSRKGYMALLPAAAQVDDLICIFLGGSVLYVLRPAGIDRYEFICECYVQGLMNGEALPKDGSKPENVVTFTLV
jgi:hypothetical protein